MLFMCLQLGAVQQWKAACARQIYGKRNLPQCSIARHHNSNQYIIPATQEYLESKVQADEQSNGAISRSN